MSSGPVRGSGGPNGMPGPGPHGTLSPLHVAFTLAKETGLRFSVGDESWERRQKTNKRQLQDSNL